MSTLFLKNDIIETKLEQVHFPNKINIFSLDQGIFKK